MRCFQANQSQTRSPPFVVQTKPVPFLRKRNRNRNLDRFLFGLKPGAFPRGQRFHAHKWLVDTCLAYHKEVICAVKMKLADVFHSDPQILGGTPVFTGTRVPVQNLVDFLEGGESIDDFLEGFPTVKREQVIGFIEAAKEKLLPA
jgi:uncharacterized protein (DUF433 family)